MKRMLLVFAHPDDESFAVAGTVAKYVRAGWQADLICATLGEAGSRGVYTNATVDTLGTIRRKELEAAGKIMGISTVTFLGYADGKLTEQTPGTLEDPVYQKMRALNPDVVITFDITGISNHPDHIRMCYVTTYAFQKYAKDTAYASQSSGDRSFAESEVKTNEPKLYYVAMPQSTVLYLKQQKVLPVESFGKPIVGVPDKFITTVIDISRFKTLKTKALKAHISQKEDTEQFLSVSNNPLTHQEHFVLRMQGEHEIFMGKNDRIADRL